MEAVSREDIPEIIREHKEKGYFMKNILRIYDVFKDFFGEEKVDLGIVEPPMDDFGKLLSKETIEEGVEAITRYWDTMIHPYILVYFPRVKVTNEHGNFVYITELYVKVTLAAPGLLGSIGMNRAEYTIDQFYSDYMHSHVCGITVSDGNFEGFKTPCLGVGPIQGTSRILRNEVRANEDWMLFCYELSKFVTVESLSGGPYRRLETITNSTEKMDHIGYKRGQRLPKLIINFAKHLILSRKLKFAYRNGSYVLGMTSAECMILVSNEFINWCNKLSDAEGEQKKYVRRHHMELGVVSKGHIYNTLRSPSSLEDVSEHIGKPVCTFKGRKIKLRITGGISVASAQSLFLSKNVISEILSVILEVINLKYGKNEQQCENSGSEEPQEL